MTIQVHKIYYTSTQNECQTEYIECQKAKYECQNTYKTKVTVHNMGVKPSKISVKPHIK